MLNIGLSLLLAILLLSGCVKYQEAITTPEESSVKPIVQSPARIQEPVTNKPTDSNAESPGRQSTEDSMAVEGGEEERGSAMDSRSHSQGFDTEKRRDEIEINELNLDELVERLKKTDAIGILTKLTIRSDVLDFKDIVDSYRERGQLEKHLAELKERFNGLLLKILALLERDPSLSKDIYLARESIWKSFVEAKS